MRLSIEEDVSAEPGHALLRLQGVAPAADMRFRLSRKAQEPPNLGLDGWQAEPALLEPQEVRAEGGDTVLLVGPEVVDHIPFNTPVEIEVPALGAKAQEWWPDIAPSPGGPASARLRASRPAPPKPAAPVAPAPPAAGAARAAGSGRTARAARDTRTRAGTASSRCRRSRPQRRARARG